MSTIPSPPAALLDLCVPPRTSIEARGLLDRALDAVGDLGCDERLVAVLLPRSVEVRATPGLDIPSDHELREIGLALRGGATEVEVAGRQRPLAARSQETGAGRQVYVLADVEPDGPAALDAWCPVVLMSLSLAGLVLHDRTRDAEVSRLQETAQRVAASLELDDVLSEIVRDAVDLLDADSGDMLLLDEGRGRLRVVAVADFPSDMVGFEMDLGEGVSSRAMGARRAVIVNDYERYRHRVRRLDRYRFRAVLCAPLIARGEPIGALNVHATTTRRRFEQEDARVLTTFANHAAIAIDNATRYRNEVRLAEDLAHANRELDRSLTLQQRVVRQVLLDRGPSAVAQELADVLGRAVVVQDHAFQVLAGAAPVRPRSSDVDPQALALPRGGSSVPGLDDALATLRETGEPVVLPANEGGAARLLAAIRLGPETAGYLVMNAGGAVEPLDRALIEVAATGVALEFAKLRSQVAFEQRLRGDVVGDLITGSYASAASITARAARIGLDLSAPCDVVVVRMEGSSALDEGLGGDRVLELKRRFADVVGAAVPSGAVVAIQGDVAVVLAPSHDARTEPPETLAEGLLRALEEELPELACSAAVGDRCSSPDDYRGSFRLAVNALDAVQKLGRRARVVSAGSLGVSRLLISAVDASELHGFARRSLAPLLGDGERHRELLSTLEAYVEAGFNQREAARRSFVHFNTVAYRLRRVEQLLGVDLDDPQARLDLTLALRIATLAGLSPHHKDARQEV